MATHTAPSPASFPNSLTRYLYEIRQFAMLSPQDELRLARRWIDHRDRAAAELLLTSHLGLIVKIATGFRGYRMPLSELVAEGNVGMMQAIERFDLDRDCRLSTYAMWWIRAAMLEYILRSLSLVRLCTTPGQKRLFFNLRKLKDQLQQTGDLNAEAITKIATQLDVSHGDVVMMDQRMRGPDQSLNTTVTAEGDEEWQDRLVDHAPDQEAVLADRQELEQRRHLLQQAMTQLDERERHILTARRLRERPLKLAELASQYGVSLERIRQIEVRAFSKIQEALGQMPQRLAERRSRSGSSGAWRGDHKQIHEGDVFAKRIEFDQPVAQKASFAAQFPQPGSQVSCIG